MGFSRAIKVFSSVVVEFWALRDGFILAMNCLLVEKYEKIVVNLFASLILFK